MTFDTEVFLEKISEEKPIVIFMDGGTIHELYMPEGESSPSYLVIECGDDNNECDFEDHDTLVEILDGADYVLTTPATYTDFICDTTESADGCNLLDD
jgi:hypothetical protein